MVLSLVAIIICIIVVIFTFAVFLPTFMLCLISPLCRRDKFLSNQAIFSERELKFMFAVCHRPSVCRLSSATFVRPTQTIEIFVNVSMPFDILAIDDLSVKTLRRSSQGNSSVGGVKHKRGSRI